MRTRSKIVSLAALSAVLVLAVPVAAHAAIVTYANNVARTQNSAVSGGPFGSVTGGSGWSNSQAGVTNYVQSNTTGGGGGTYLGGVTGPSGSLLQFSHGIASTVYSSCRWTSSHSISGTDGLTCRVHTNYSVARAADEGDESSAGGPSSTGASAIDTASYERAAADPHGAYEGREEYLGEKDGTQFWKGTNSEGMTCLFGESIGGSVVAGSACVPGSVFVERGVALALITSEGVGAGGYLLPAAAEAARGADSLFVTEPTSSTSSTVTATNAAGEQFSFPSVVASAKQAVGTR